MEQKLKLITRTLLVNSRREVKNLGTLVWHENSKITFSGTCKLDNSAIAATISSYDTVYISFEGTEALAQSINDHGPHATHLYVNDNFRHYESGIFEDYTCPTYKTNHAVINVGYDTVEGYWLIRNSWGPDWGDAGHIKMAMGQNTCNVESDAWLPKV